VSVVLADVWRSKNDKNFASAGHCRDLCPRDGRYRAPMRFHSSVAVVLLVLFTSAGQVLRAGQSPAAVPAAAAGPMSPTGDAVTATVTTYCSGCHNGVMRSPSNALLDRFDGAAIGDDAEAWTRAYRQVQAGTMPPAGAPRPDRAAARRLLASIETALAVATRKPAEATGKEIADRLAAMLWNSPPDATLLEEARRNRLRQPAVMVQQVKRMLADDRADAFVAGFFVPWLGLDRLVNVNPSPKNFPGFDPSLREAMATETRLFILSQLREDADPIALWTAADTFLNEPLARHYGIGGVTGAQFRRVSLTMPERYGLLGKASILMLTSRHSDGPAYTSPAARSIWIRNHFLGAPAPRPFPGAQPVSPDRPITPQTRKLPSQPCLQCHQNFFPLAYPLETFDAIGRWRTEDQEGPVDASGVYVDGAEMRGVTGLRDTLLRYPDAFRTTLTERLLLYAGGTPANEWRVTPETLVRARQALRGSAPPRWSSLIAAIARSRL
jgi:hypothetical protein